MRIATWNINGLKARLDYLCLWLAERRPDVVGLQELKTEDAQFPHARFAELGYVAHVHGEKAWNGVAVLSRGEAEVFQRGLPGQEALGARLIGVRVAGLDFTTVYCPNGKTLAHVDYQRKLDWFEALAAYWAERHAPDRATVLCGDFNVVPHATDSWRGADGDGEIFHTTLERERFATLLALGLIDLYRDRHPEGRAYSWWDYRGGSFHRGHGLRIDTLLGSEAVRRRVVEVVIDRDFRKKQGELTPSDHAPVYADLSDR
ncbi:MAG: exodeoxyribonuclease III [Pseudomonadales bacterium]|nr:exodeoxyribonuclease III [Pseudomonadales bacterium]